MSPVTSPVSPTPFPAPSHPVFLLNAPISYLMVSSVVGFYSSPLFTRLLPERQDTPLTKVGAAGRGWGAPGLPWGCRTPFPTVCPLCVPVHCVVSLRGRTVSHCRAGPQWFSDTWKAPSPAWGLPAAALPPPQTSSFSPDHRELCLLAGAQLSAARLLQDTG